jgi:2-keto-4-pentenoate hydratase/2-oxohepta-3-ene-1,7-dioic acid hydratase in catechol pathway
MTQPFGLGTFETAVGERFAGLVMDERVVRLDRAEGAPSGSIEGLLDDWEVSFPALGELATKLDGLESDAVVALAGLRVLLPFRAKQLLQAGANYRTHVIDLAVQHRSGEDAEIPEYEFREKIARMMDERATKDRPYLFIGLPRSMCGPYDDVILPTGSEQHDWELELGAVVGRRAHHIARSEALDVVAAYVIANDLTTRDRVFREDMPAIGTDWFRSKNGPAFLPTGPWLVPSAFVPDPQDLRITLRLNGQVMQNESTSDMLFDVARLIEYASSVVDLQPGDLLLTGSPAGNGLHWGRTLRPGDVMEGEITGLGVQRSCCVADAGDDRP